MYLGNMVEFGSKKELIEFFKDVLLRIEVTGYKVSVAVILK